MGLALEGFLRPAHIVTSRTQPDDNLLRYIFVSQDSHDRLPSIMASMSAQVTLDSFAPVAAYC